MGGITKKARISGKTLGIAFQELQDEDRRENGEAYDSGGWNNAMGVREVGKAEYQGGSNKFEPAIALCIQKPIENKNTIKTIVNRHPNKGTRGWKTLYVAEPMYHQERYISLPKAEEKLADAITSARKFVGKNPHIPLTIRIVKELQGSDKCADIMYKKSSTERDGIWEVTGTMSY